MKGRAAYNPRQIVNDGLLGQYSVGANTGLIGVGVNGEIFQFRWPDSLRIAAVRKIVVSAAASTPFAAAPASNLNFAIAKLTGWTVQGTGGTVLDTSAGSCKRRSQMPTSLLTAGDMRVATTAALGGGTKTFDALAMASVTAVPVSANTCPILAPTEMLGFKESEMDYPLVLTQNEGFSVVIQNNPGTGTMFVSISVDWMEAHAS